MNNVIGQVEEQTPFLTTSKFANIIENKVLSKKIDYLDAILEFCEENDIPYEHINRFVSSNLKEKLEQNFIERGMLGGKAQLPI